jgi:hypothetical protein
MRDHDSGSGLTANWTNQPNASGLYLTFDRSSCSPRPALCYRPLPAAETELHLPGRVALGAELTPTRGAAHLESRIGELHVVQSVEAEELELHAHALCDLDVLPEAHIQVPVGQATDRANASVLAVNAQNRGAEGAVGSNWVSEDVGRAAIVMHSGASGIRRFDLEALLVVEEVGAVSRTECLSIGVGVAVQRQAAARGEGERCSIHQERGQGYPAGSCRKELRTPQERCRRTCGRSPGDHTSR